MNEIVNNVLLVGDKYMHEMHLKQPGFTYRACGPFTNNRERIEKLLQTGNTDYIYKNDLDKACLQHDMAYDKYKDLNKRTQLDNVLRDKAFKIAGNPKYDGYQRGLVFMVNEFLIKNPQVVVLNLHQINNLQVDFISQLLKNGKEEKFIIHLKTIFGVLI